MKITIYQLKDIENSPYAFRGYESAKNKLNIDDYAEVYEYEGVPDESGDVFGMLEDVYLIFNTQHPKDFKGHSLSVSDIVMVGDRYFYCDSVGWTELDPKKNFSKKF